jgi:hypothetical protein
MAQQASPVQARREPATPTAGRTLSRSKPTKKKKSDGAPMGHYVGIAVTLLLLAGTVAAFVIWGVPIADHVLAFGGGSTAGKYTDNATRSERPLPSPAGKIEEDGPAESETTETKQPEQPAAADAAQQPTEIPDGTGETPAEQPIPDTEAQSKFPKFVDIPPVKEKGLASLYELADVPEEGIKVDTFDLKCDLCQVEEGKYFYAQPDESAKEEQRWTIHPAVKDQPPGANPAIATISVRGRDILFQWLDEADKAPTADQLRNAVAHVVAAASSRYMALRAPITSEPITMDLSKRYIAKQLPLPAPPKLTEVTLEVTKAEGFPNVPKFKFSRKQASLNNDPPDLVILQLAKVNEADTPEFHLQGAFGEGGAIDLKVSPMIVNGKGIRQELSQAAIDKIRENYQAQYDAIDKDWTHFRDEGILLERQIREANQGLGKKGAGSLSAKKSRLATVNREFRKLDIKKKQLEPIMKALPEYERVITNTHDKAQIRYKIRVKAGDLSIDLFDTKQDDGA